jgi:DNA-binding response OmpR family regulator
VAIRILYVEDDESIQQLVSMHLSLDGFEVTIAADGNQAIDCLEQESYDLVLLDIEMSVPNGLDVLRYIRNHDIDTRAVMLTAARESRIMNACAKWGAVDYVQKPYNIHELLEAIDRVMAEPA